MTEWILILYLASGYTGGPTSVVFQSEQECRQAGEYVKKAHSTGLGWARYYCFKRTALGKTEGQS